MAELYRFVRTDLNAHSIDDVYEKVGYTEDDVLRLVKAAKYEVINRPELAPLRAALSPTIGADDEALIDAFEKACVECEALGASDTAPTKKHLDMLGAAYSLKREALRRRIAGLLEERNRLIDELSYADLRVTNIEDRAEAAERELAEVRAALQGIVDDDAPQVSLAEQRSRWDARIAAAERALKTKEPTNG